MRDVRHHRRDLLDEVIQRDKQTAGDGIHLADADHHLVATHGGGTAETEDLPGIRHPVADRVQQVSAIGWILSRKGEVTTSDTVDEKRRKIHDAALSVEDAFLPCETDNLIQDGADVIGAIEE